MYQFLTISEESPNCASTCTKHDQLTTKTTNSWLSSSLSFFIILLPKCPFCIVAYTSSMAMCGASPLVSHHTDWGAWAALLLGGSVIYSIYRNRRGQGTFRALAVASLGLALVMVGIFIADVFVCYYIGSVILLLAAFYNGSGFRFFHKSDTV